MDFSDFSDIGGFSYLIASRMFCFRTLPSSSFLLFVVVVVIGPGPEGPEPLKYPDSRSRNALKLKFNKFIFTSVQR